MSKPQNEHELAQVIDTAKTLAKLLSTTGIVCHGPISYCGLVFDYITISATGEVDGALTTKDGRDQHMLVFNFQLSLG